MHVVFEVIVLGAIILFQLLDYLCPLSLKRKTRILCCVEEDILNEHYLFWGHSLLVCLFC